MNVNGYNIRSVSHSKARFTILPQDVSEAEEQEQVR